MARNMNDRLSTLENYAPIVANGDNMSPLAMLQACVEDHGGQRDNESWANATARILEINSADLMAYLKARATGETSSL